MKAVVTGASDRSSKALRHALGKFATGVTVITVEHQGRPWAITANSFTSVSLNPPLVLWCVGHSSQRHAAFATAPRFVVSVLHGDQALVGVEVARMGTSGLRPELTNPTTLGPPSIKGALAVFECETKSAEPHGDHTVIIGQVVRFSVGAHPTPLIFHEGRFCKPPLRA